jgi:FAD/FMN-containing dehydrogenase
MSTTTAVPTTTPWNVFADQRPAETYVATSVEEVQAAIEHARDHGLRVAPQTTGHFAGALPDLHDALLLRLAFDEPVAVDPDAMIARIPAGAIWDDVVIAAAAHGLAVMHGSSPTVSPFGYLLGGGLSFYGRAHGMAANHVKAIEVVTPDGVHRRAHADENSELFYALRGGGGGYGVVTSIEIGLLPYATVTGGALLFGPPAAKAVLTAWRDWAKTAPETITTSWRLMHPPHDAPFVIVDGVALEPSAAADLERVLRAAAEPFAGGFGPMPVAAVARLHGDPEDPTPAIVDGILLDHLDDQAIDAFLRVATPNSPLVMAELRQIGGALATAPAHAGARGHLEGEFGLMGLGAPGASGTPEEIRAHLRALMEAMQPAATGTRYANFAEQWSRQRGGSLRTSVSTAAFERLARLRAELDPDGLMVAPFIAN